MTGIERQAAEHREARVEELRAKLDQLAVEFIDLKGHMMTIRPIHPITIGPGDVIQIEPDWVQLLWRRPEVIPFKRFSYATKKAV